VSATVAGPSLQKVTARQRVLEAAYTLFSHRGIRDVSIDEVLELSGVAKATLYRHFASKDELVLAFLDLREQVWTLDVVEAGARERAETPEGQLLAIFDVYDDWFHRDDFEACSFVNVLLEMGAAHPAGRASIEHLATLRQFVAGLAAEAELRDPQEFARSWYILMKGSIVQASEGDAGAAKRAQTMGRLLIAQNRG